jgi:hypothetical protein
MFAILAGEIIFPQGVLCSPASVKLEKVNDLSWLNY